MGNASSARMARDLLFLLLPPGRGQKGNWAMFHLVSTHKLKRGGAACGEEGVSENVILPLRHLDRVTCPSCLEQLMLAAAERVVTVDPRPRREVATMPVAAGQIGRTALAFFAHLVALEEIQRVQVAHDMVRTAYATSPLAPKVFWCAVGKACAIRPPAPSPVVEAAAAAGHLQDGRAAIAAAEVEAAAAKTMYSAVRDAMTRAQRFGEVKVFISSVWTELGGLTSMWGSLAAFKSWLVEANRSGRLVMARADLVSAMDPEMVATSEVTEGGTSWHFILDEELCPKCQTVMQRGRCVNHLGCTRARRG